jgi:hypothetical protein
MENTRLKVYLSDGAFAELDPRGIVLTAEDGYEATDTVVLDDVGWARLKEFVEVRRMLARGGPHADGS